MNTPNNSSAALATLCERYWDFICFEQPLSAILAGRSTVDDLLFRDSLKDQERRVASAKAFRVELEKISFESLQSQDRITHRLLDHDLKIMIQAHDAKDHLRPMLYPLGPESMLNYWADSSSFTCVDDAEAYIRKLRSIPESLAGIKECLAAGQQQGIHYPQVVIERATATLRGLLARPLDQSSLIQPFLKSSLQSDEFQTHKRTAETVLAEIVIPAISAYADFIEKQLGATARASIACTDAPLGQELYQFQIERYTTERDSAEEIHAFGLSEVARISDEMQQIATAEGFPGNLAGYQASLPSKTGQISPNAEALRERIEILSKRIDARIPEFFGRLPRMTYGIRSIPESISAHMPPAYAQPNPANGTTAGVHWITSLPERCPTYMHVPLAMHEAWPGHLMHLALMQEMELPEFRRHDAARYSSLVEGWALYCEWLGNEFGFYDTPDKHYGRLEMQIWRACRLVVDTGIHAKNWSRDQAIEFMRSHMSMPLITITAEVDRYIGMPGQALAYQIGYRCFRNLRIEAEQQLGSSFRIRDFHDALMATGAVTLPVLREFMQDWIQSRMALTSKAA
ncbi:MAG: DUF885 domain-containing protein [Pseudomonadota bacterium]